MKTRWIALLLVAPLACCRQQEKLHPPGTGQLDSSVVLSPGESTHPYLPLNAEKFKGEYHLPDDKAFRILLRDFPDQPGLLTNTVFYHHAEPLTLRFFYDAQQDGLSNRLHPETRSFSLLRLNATGDRLTEIRYDLERNQTDTTVYLRTKTTP